MKVLVVNAGSSSVKAQLMETETGDVFASAYCERVGISGSFMTYKRTFIINYLDQIYYEVENVENKHFWKILSLKIINSLINFLLIIVLLIFNPGYRFHDLELFVILISVLPAAHSFFNVFEIRRKIEKRIDSYDVDGYTSSLKTYVWNIFYSSLLFLLVVYDFKYYWFLIIFMIILPLIAAIESILVNKKFSEYKLLYYNQAEDKHRELFKK